MMKDKIKGPWLRLKGPSKKRLTQYVKEGASDIASLRRQLSNVQEQVQRLLQELELERQKRREYEETVMELRRTNAFLSEQEMLRQSGERGMITEADEKKLIELYKSRGTTEAQARRFAEKLMRDLQEAGIILHPCEGEVQGEAVQLQEKTEIKLTNEKTRESRQGYRDREDYNRTEPERSEDGFIEKDPKHEAGELTLRERRFK